MALPVVNAIGELKESQKLERQALQKSMRAGLLNVTKSVQSLHQSFNAAFDVQKRMLDAQEAATLAAEERRREDARKEKDVRKFDAKGLPGAAGKLYAVALGIFAFAGNALTGILKSLGVDVKKIGKAIKYQFSFIRPGIEMIKNLISSPFQKAAKAISDMKFFKVVSGFTNTMKGTFLTPVANFLKDVKSVLAPVFTKIGNTIKTVAGAFKAGTSAFGPVTKILGSLGTLVGKLFVPIKLVMGIFEAGKGAIEGFAKEGNFFQKIINGIFGAIGGLAGSFIGGIADLAKSGISFIFGALGFDAVEEFLDSFSFEDSIKKIFSYIGELVASPIDAFKGIIEWAKETFTIKNLKKSIVGGVKGLFGGGDDEEEEEEPAPEKKTPNKFDRITARVDREKESARKSKKQTVVEEEPYVFGAGIDGGEEFDENDFTPVEMPARKPRPKVEPKAKPQRVEVSAEEKEARRKKSLDNKIRSLSSTVAKKEERLAKGVDMSGRKMSDRDIKRASDNLEKQRKKLEEMKKLRGDAGAGASAGGAPVVAQVNSTTNSQVSNSSATTAPAGAGRASGQQYKLASGF